MCYGFAMHMKAHPKRYQVIFLSVLLVVTIVRMWLATTLPLSGDESYHWEWSRHPAWGYYDHPGLTAYLIRSSTTLFGRSNELSVRFPAIMLLAGTSLIAYLFAGFLVRQRNGGDTNAAAAGLLAGSLIIFMPTFAGMSVYMSTDPPVIFFWAASLYLLARSFYSGNWHWWILAGIAVGLAMLSKFLAFPIVLATFIFALISPQDRKWLSRPQPYVAGICALITFSPVILWNAQNEWATFMFNFSYRQKEAGIALWHIPEYIAGQALLVLTPGIFIYALIAMRRMLARWRIEKDRLALLLLLSSVVPLAYFFYISFTRQVGLHWPVAGWFGAVVFLASDWFTTDDARPATLSSSKKASIICCVLMTVTIHAAALTPHSWVDALCRRAGVEGYEGLLRLSGERYGWKTMGNRVVEISAEMQADENASANGVFVICSQYGVASNIAFYTPGQITTHLWSRRRIHGENYRFWDDFSELKGKDALFVVKRQKNIDFALPILKRHFAVIGEPESVPIFVDGSEVRSFIALRCYQFDGITPEFDI